MDNIKAELIHDFRSVTPEGGIIQMIIWKVPIPVPPTNHGFKYRLVYIMNGRRIVGYDNERGKGDHCHLDGVEHAYEFATLERLIEDFIVEVEKRRKR